jgi:MYXO-CTERM domain-containing protein
MLRPRRSLLVVLALNLVATRARADSLEDWPCKGCFTHVPDGAGASPGPRPLLVALHGDGGGAKKLFQSWKAASDAAGVILMAPRCPVSAGCPAGSFWQWYFSAQHDPAWLGAQIDAVTARYPIDPARIYATGYSGGATYLGYYGPQNPKRFAAVAHVAGGKPFDVPCPACKLPVLFVIGATDPMVTPYTRPLRDYYQACGGHEVVWEVLPGVTHEGILDVLRAGRSKRILDWLLARPAACLSAPPDAGLDAAAKALVEDAEKPPTPADAEAPAFDAGGAPPPPPPRPPPGCACDMGEGPPSFATGAAAGVALALLGARRRRRRTRSPRPCGDQSL